MTAYIKYRVSDGEEPWTANTIKGEPLTNREIDTNWKTVVTELETKASKTNPQLSGTVIIDSDTALGVPCGTTEDREKIVPLEQGMIRFNTDKNTLEYYNGTIWETLGKVAQGGNEDEIFFLNDKVIRYNYTIPEGKNAMTAGPITINSGVTVTIPEGSTWTIVGDNVPELYTTYIGPKTITG